MADRKEVGRHVWSPIVKLACSDFQFTRIGDRQVEDEVARLKMKSPDVASGDQAVGDRQNKHIAEDEGEADYEGGRRDHREGV